MTQRRKTKRRAHALARTPGRRRSRPALGPAAELFRRRRAPLPRRLAQALAVKRGGLGWRSDVVAAADGGAARRARRRRRRPAAGAGQGRRVPACARLRLLRAASGPRPSGASTRSSPRRGSPTCSRSRPRVSRDYLDPEGEESRPLDDGEIAVLRELARRRRRLRPARAGPPHPPLLPAPPLRALRPERRRGRRADRRCARAAFGGLGLETPVFVAALQPLRRLAVRRCSPSASRSSAAGRRASACSASARRPAWRRRRRLPALLPAALRARGRGRARRSSG